MPVGPTQIHAQQNFRPILGFGAAGAGVERNDRIAPIIGPAEDLRELGLSHSLSDLCDFGCRFLQSLVALFFTGKVKKKTSLFEVRSMLLPIFYDSFKRGLFFEYRLSLVGVVPEIRLGCDLS
jgi:hypothetical protein